ncbi:acyltransferase [Cohnella fermenti]|uniref:Acyltransferase n=1 Tax=Cohnella fermenti TaxID=2565925 RepID=A0A4S4BZS3_9BACL|nr:acyltransferase [Cohnella fermenti]THF80780.1 hypothetical protein E6C55_09860 [Cohnella fermenti]
MNRNQMINKILSMKNENKLSDKRIVIWGVGTHGKQLSLIIEELGFRVSYFLDSDNEKAGQAYEGIPIFLPDTLLNNSSDYFIFVATTKFDSRIEKKLQQFGYDSDENYYYFCKFPIISLSSAEDYSDELNNSISGKFQGADSKVIFKGKNNRLEIANGVKLEKCTIRFEANNGYLSIGPRSLYRGLINIGNGCEVRIGCDLFVTADCLIMTAEETKVTIGDDCMFATGVQIRTHDSHPIFSVHDGQRINPARSIEIGHHVWLAYSVTLLSGCSIGEGSVIGHSSLVKGNIPNNCIAVGTPAKMIKKDIAWDKAHVGKTFPYSFLHSEYIGNRTYWKETSLFD